MSDMIPVATIQVSQQQSVALFANETGIALGNITMTIHHARRLSIGLEMAISESERMRRDGVDVQAPTPVTP